MGVRHRDGILGLAVARLSGALARQLDAEQGRWCLWIPVFFGAGVGLYFELLEEPDTTLALELFIAALAVRVLSSSNLFAFLVSSILLCICAGFLGAKLRTNVMAAPILERHGAYDVEGFVEGFDRQTPRRGRAVIRLLSLKYENKDVAKKPFRIRVSVRGEETLNPGSTVKFRAILVLRQSPSCPVVTISLA